ncbi:MAG: VCBS repeat-containing protein [Planctomycetes bacterium]|nr:VCBS repeat-containing protein [Planctomycetota bacterium]
MDRCRSLAAVLSVAVLLYVTAAYGLINPRFTPIHLVEQSALIVWVELKQGASKDEYTAAIREVLKGKTELKRLRLDLSKAADAQAAVALRDLAAAGKPALFFMGEFEDAGNQGGGAAKSRGLLHIAGKWAVFDGGEDGLWALDKIDRMLQAVWAGGTDMLRRAVDYILTDDDPAVPVTDGVSWSAGPMKAATLDGAIKSVRPVDLAGDGKLTLFVACDTGDRLLACEGAKRRLADLTAARGLRSKSHAFAWGDFAGQGRLDLISFDGKALSLHAQQADGTFQARPLDLGSVLEHGCLGLAALDAGVKGRSGLLVTGDAWPVLVAFDVDGKPSPTALSGGRIDLARLGKAGPCLVADFGGDGIGDVLAPREAGSVLFRGLGQGKFAPGVACAVKLGSSPSAACLGDFDADGRFDVLSANPDGTCVWQNEGDGKFTETLDLAGELAYAAERRGIDCMAGDINNDGRQDILIAYGAAGPRVFFNRGFRSFGFSQTLNLGLPKLLPAAEAGQQSACFSDLDGDGAQDLALALRNGEVWVAFRANDDPDRQAMMAVAILPVGGPYKGPVAVTGWIGKRCLGAWNVLPGVSHACFGRTDAGPVTLKWRLPGGKEQQKEVILENAGNVRMEIK